MSEELGDIALIGLAVMGQVSSCGLYYKCLTIIIYDRDDVASTIKLQLQS
jgi:hypothetical protein